MEELEGEIAEYDLVRLGKVKIEVTSIYDLGQSLVNARIKSGMDQEALATYLGVGKSLIVGSEVNQYLATTIDVIRNVAKVFDVAIPEHVLPSNFKGKMSGILTKLKKAGLDQKFVLSRLISPDTNEKVAEQKGGALDRFTFGLYTNLNQNLWLDVG